MMDYSLSYTNHAGKTASLMSRVIAYGHSEIRNYRWSYELRGNSVSRLYREPREVEIEIAVKGGAGVRNDLFELFESDVLAAVPGTLTLSGYEARAFVIGKTNTNYWIAENYMNTTITVLLVDGVWTKPVMFRFAPESAAASGGYLDYPFDYPFDFAPGAVTKTVNVKSLGASDFELVVYGGATNPYISISGNTYQVNASIDSGDVITIDSRKKSIVKRANDGYETSLYARRLKGAKGSGQYVFERVPSGFSDISWPASFGFDLTVFTERSEVEWM